MCFPHCCILGVYGADDCVGVSVFSSQVLLRRLRSYLIYIFSDIGDKSFVYELMQ